MADGTTYRRGPLGFRAVEELHREAIQGHPRFHGHALCTVDSGERNQSGAGGFAHDVGRVSVLVGVAAGRLLGTP